LCGRAVQPPHVLAQVLSSGFGIRLEFLLPLALGARRFRGHPKSAASSPVLDCKNGVQAAAVKQTAAAIAILRFMSPPSIIRYKTHRRHLSQIQPAERETLPTPRLCLNPINNFPEERFRILPPSRIAHKFTKNQRMERAASACPPNEKSSDAITNEEHNHGANQKNNEVVLRVPHVHDCAHEHETNFESRLNQENTTAK